MKKFFHCRDGASQGAFVALVAVLGLPYFAAAQTPTPTPTCYFLVSAQIANPGSYYVVNDTLDPVSGTLCAPADNYGFRLQVTSVSAGHVTAVSIMTPPASESWVGYSVPPSNPISFGGSATGTGFTANCTFTSSP